MQQFSLGQAVATESCQLDVQWPGRTSLGTDQSGDGPAWGRALGLKARCPDSHVTSRASLMLTRPIQQTNAVDIWLMPVPW